MQIEAVGDTRQGDEEGVERGRLAERPRMSERVARDRAAAIERETALRVELKLLGEHRGPLLEAHVDRGGDAADGAEIRLGQRTPRHIHRLSSVACLERRASAPLDPDYSEAGAKPLALKTSRECRAIMRSSSVGMTKTAAGEALALMIWALALVRLVVDHDPHPFHAGEHGLADARGILADAAGEDDALDAVDGRGETRELAPDAVRRNSRSRRAPPGCRRPRARACPGRRPTCP